MSCNDNSTAPALVHGPHLPPLERSERGPTQDDFIWCGRELERHARLAGRARAELEALRADVARLSERIRRRAPRVATELDAALARSAADELLVSEPLALPPPRQLVLASRLPGVE